jgi:hypothetical protein
MNEYGYDNDLVCDILNSKVKNFFEKAIVLGKISKGQTDINELMEMFEPYFNAYYDAAERVQTEENKKAKEDMEK